MINPARGETPIQIHGEIFAMRPTLDAMLRIEKSVGKSVFALVTQLGDPRNLQLTDVLAILEIGLRAGPDAAKLPSSAKLREQLYDLGFLLLIKVCAAFLGQAVGASDVVAGEEPGEDPKGNE